MPIKKATPPAAPAAIPAPVTPTPTPAATPASGVFVPISAAPVALKLVPETPPVPPAAPAPTTVVHQNNPWPWIVGLLVLLGLCVLLALSAFAFRNAIAAFFTPTQSVVTAPAPAVQQTPVVQPTPMPAVAPTQPAAQTSGYGLPPQPYIPHPSSYQETGKGSAQTQTWTIPVLDGTTLVYGGFTVGNESNGVYGAIQGPTTVTLTVTDGFYSVVASQWGQQEYCFRLSQALQYGWAHAHLYPLPGYSCP